MQHRIPMNIDNSFSQDNKQDNQQMVSDEKLSAHFEKAYNYYLQSLNKEIYCNNLPSQPVPTSLSFFPVYTTTAPAYLKDDLIKFRNAIREYSPFYDKRNNKHISLAYYLWENNPSLQAWLNGKEVNVTTENSTNPQTISPSVDELFRNFKAIANAIVLLTDAPITPEVDYADLIDAIWQNNERLQNIVKDKGKGIHQDRYDYKSIEKAICKTNKILNAERFPNTDPLPPINKTDALFSDAQTMDASLISEDLLTQNNKIILSEMLSDKMMPSEEQMANLPPAHSTPLFGEPPIIITDLQTQELTIVKQNENSAWPYFFNTCPNNDLPSAQDDNPYRNFFPKLS